MTGIANSILHPNIAGGQLLLSHVPASFYRAIWPVLFQSAIRRKWYWKYNELKKSVIPALKPSWIGSAEL